jgi:hypothetical protein
MYTKKCFKLDYFKFPDQLNYENCLEIYSSFVKANRHWMKFTARKHSIGLLKIQTTESIVDEVSSKINKQYCE